MRKTIHFTNALWDEDGVKLHANMPVQLSGVQAAEQMIVDSDEKAFVYLAEEKDEFIYLYIHETVWEDLEKALKEEARLFVSGEDVTLELTGWKEELGYLIGNIEGNSNYGEEMVKKVESVFLHHQ
ncbi:hypothetical protein [Bacillus badius]|uniref:Uncharacterized protein n=1 Tax=Bacillus badius TaxID=1455 RepID=A0ABR5ASF3_BACBA|nr:hypothetical protein [Bacillus badius]KIL73120.1 hypothetical protein SD78_3308 [Bacillus badius]KIL77665.1 hypothetical protein SD77_1338 [Bacillus badius]KZO01232.1 hypothetical protein A4244_13280 [Bacillus badius]MED0667922.1 hypothetical protein [Bacillus badius]MED4718787.1 hypothetical protein [Bacillus badius]